MGAEVNNPEIQPGVPTDHPRIVEAVKTGLSRGISKEEVAKRTGMPIEQVETIRSTMPKQR